MLLQGNEAEGSPERAQSWPALGAEMESEGLPSKATPERLVSICPELGAALPAPQKPVL